MHRITEYAENISAMENARKVQVSRRIRKRPSAESRAVCGTQNTVVSEYAENIIRIWRICGKNLCIWKRRCPASSGKEKTKCG